jgi:lysophospholipase
MFANYSDFARENSDGGNVSAFALGAAPMPIMVLSEVVPGQSPEIGRIMFPGRNSTNGFNLTSYEVNPYEFGSWLGGRVQAFFPTRYLGTNMSDGMTMNNSQCVQGFDKLTFISGSTTDAYDAYLIDDFYKIPVFAKRSAGLEDRQSSSSDASNEIPIPEGQEENPIVEIVNQTASNFDQTFNESLWATYPNPFANYNDEMRGVDELLLLDGSMTGETNPIRPLIIPDRHVDFIIVYEASSDAKYGWVNGTNLISASTQHLASSSSLCESKMTDMFKQTDTARSASESNIPFPAIPDVDTMITNNLTRQPTFFGCNSSSAPADTPAPLVLYLPNSPWSAYSNYSFRKTSFTDNELDVTLDNAFQLATYGNGTVDSQWPACVACAVVRSSMQRLGMTMPQQCVDCFQRHCWSGNSTSSDVTEADLDPSLRLEPGMTYEKWNRTVWSAQSNNEGGGSGSGSDSDSDSDGQGETLHVAGRATYAGIVALAVAVFMFNH